MTLIPMNLSSLPNTKDTFPINISINEIQSFYPAHRHDFLEFSLILEGKGVEIINGKRQELMPGVCSFILPYQIHEIHADPKHPIKLYNCAFNMDLMFKPFLRDSGFTDLLLGGSTQFEKPSSIHLDIVQRNNFISILTQMKKEFEDSEEWSNVLLESKLIELLIVFERNRQKSLVKSPNESIQCNKNIWEIIFYIHSNFHEDISLTYLANKFHISVSYLSELIKQHMGENFVSLLHEIRIRHACSLLVSTELPVLTVAMEVGYNSFKTFSRVFRKLKQTTPTLYREMNKLKETPSKKVL